MSPDVNEILLHYRILEKIGEGGMGVVWKALDTTLDREVAIKVLPDAFANDDERRVRFEREAKLLASLNHSNVAAIHGLHETRGVYFLAMELVAGEDLAERLARGRLPVDEALDVARQIAEGLEAAHENGVVHRDLKPANVKLTPDGRIKILDFGLAKAIAPDPGSKSFDLSLSPTLTSAGTHAGTRIGTILGTAAYMSPEQARGKPADRRSDLWSLGCVLYECLTGVQLFRGETASDSLAAILRKDPDWSALPAETPPMVRSLLQRCLARDPRKRLQSAGDARVELEQAIEDPHFESLGFGAGGAGGEYSWIELSATRFLPWAAAAAALLVAAFFAMRGSPTAPDSLALHRLTIPLPAPTDFGERAASPPAISPDGRTVVFGVQDESGASRLWLRPLDDFSARPLAGTEGAQFAFWSPDSRHIGFIQGGELRSVDVETGLLHVIAGETSPAGRGGSWNSSGQIIFAPTSNTGIHLVDAAGGEAHQITTPDPEVPDNSHRWPWFLPDGEHFLFVFWTNDLAAQEQHGGVYVASLSGAEEPRRLVSDASSVAYVPQGYLLVMRGENLIAIPFDARKNEITGEAAVVATGVLRNRSHGHSAFSASLDGTLVYAVGEAFVPSTLAWYDRAGTSTPTMAEPAAFFLVRLAPGAAPESARAAVSIPGANGDPEIWILDLARGVRTRLTSGAAAFDFPVWSESGDRILYAAQGGGGGKVDLYVRFADGSGDTEPVLINDMDKNLFDWSRDGRYIAYSPAGRGGASGPADIWIYSVERQTTGALISGDPEYWNAQFSPNARWIAYESDESGRFEIFVRAFDGDGDGDGSRGTGATAAAGSPGSPGSNTARAGARWQLSTAGGASPHWRDDGREIVYLDPEQRMMAVAVEERDGKLVLGSPRELFTVEGTIQAEDATGDHQRFLIATRDEINTKPLYVILNWPAGL